MLPAFGAEEERQDAGDGAECSVLTRHIWHREMWRVGDVEHLKSEFGT